MIGDTRTVRADARPGQASETSVETANPPVRADVTATPAVGVTLVRVELRSSVDVDLRVRVRNELDGPVLPPRREGVPEAGWEADGFAGVVPAGGRLGVGYACPTADSAADLRSNRPSVADDGRGDELGVVAGDAVSIELLGPANDALDADAPPGDAVVAAVRSLGRAAPPSDAIPAESAATCARDEPVTDADGVDGSDVPSAVAEWLDAVETRIERGELLTDASAAEATAALEDWGVDAVAALPGVLDADEGSLRDAAERIDELAARAADADPGPVATALSTAAGATDADREAGLERPGAR